MKKVFLICLAALISELGFAQQGNLNQKIVGRWMNPYNYMYNGEMQGYEILEKGKCNAVNFPLLTLRKWKIDKKGNLILRGKIKNEQGKYEKYESCEEIIKLTKDSLVVAGYDELRMKFIFLQEDYMKKLIKEGKIKKE